MRRLYGYILTALIMAILSLAEGVSATRRGISIVSEEGENLYLYTDRYALVVGISEYEKWPKLPNAVNDAKAVAAKLKEMGFEVKLVLDPTSRAMKAVLNEMVYELGREENRALLFYYAGHGETETMADNTKLGYLIPTDCPLLKKDPMGFATHATSMKDIESISLRIRSKHVLMIFDSCFSGSLFALVRALPEDITEKSTLPVRQYITAGREDEQVPDRSMFKRCFLLGLEGEADLTRDGYITGSELGMYLSEKVVNYTRRQQHPQYGKINNPELDRGDFIFVPRGAEVAARTASVDEERRRLAEEQELLRQEREQLEAEKRLLEERKLLESERRDLEKEKQELVYAPQTVKGPIDELRHGQGRFVIDDFEDGDLWARNWKGRWAASTRGKARLEVTPDPTQGANGTSSSMRMEYKITQQSSAMVWIGGSKTVRISEVEKDESNAYDLSRFKKIVFHLKGRKKRKALSKLDSIYVQIVCYGKHMSSKYGKAAHYVHKSGVLPGREWERIRIPFDDLVPSPFTKRHVSNFPLKPDLHNVLIVLFTFSGSKEDRSSTGSNTVWIDEVALE
jgi:uncharacterized caspase-like protein